MLQNSLALLSNWISPLIKGHQKLVTLFKEKYVCLKSITQSVNLVLFFLFPDFRSCSGFYILYDPIWKSHKSWEWNQFMRAHELSLLYSSLYKCFYSYKVHKSQFVTIATIKYLKYSFWSQTFHLTLIFKSDQACLCFYRLLMFLAFHEILKICGSNMIFSAVFSLKPKILLVLLWPKLFLDNPRVKNFVT